MIPTINEIIDENLTGMLLEIKDYDLRMFYRGVIEEILKEYGNQVVDQCGDIAFRFQETNEMNRQIEKVKDQII